MAKQTDTGPAEKPCECSHWWIGTTVDHGDDEPTFEDTDSTGCGSLTRRQFAPGHDAKLAKLLIKAGVDGLEAHDGRGTSGGSLEMSARFGFAEKVRKGIAAGLAKAERRAARQTKTTEEAAAQAAPTVHPLDPETGESVPGSLDEVIGKIKAAKRTAPATGPRPVSVRVVEPAANPVAPPRKLGAPQRRNHRKHR